MSLVNKTTPKKNVVELEISIEKDVFDAAVMRAYKKNVQKMNIPGFRKGKAPKSIVEKMYGKGVFYEDALEELVPDAFAEAVKESGDEAVSRPEYDVVSIDEKGAVVKAKFFVKPEVSIADYKGIEVTEAPVSVTDAEVDDAIEHTRERNSRMLDITDRAVQNGDTVIIDFDGYVDGKQFEGGKSEKYTLVIGSGQFIPGFEEQIIGKSIGDVFDVNVEFPKEYHAEELAGKPAVFKIVLHAIKYNEKPALDDEFAKDVSDFGTLAEYKADVLAKLTEEKKKEAERETEGKLIDKLLEKLEADIPEAMFETETDNLIRDYDSRLRMQGMDLETYFKYTGSDIKSMHEQLRPNAERQVKTRLALEKIAELENVEVTEEDVKAEYARIAEAYNMKVEEVEKLAPADGIKKDLRVQKAVDFVKANAKITIEAAADKKEEKIEKAEKADPEKKKAPAKKTAAKAGEKAASEKKPAAKAKAKAPKDAE